MNGSDQVPAPGSTATTRRPFGGAVFARVSSLTSRRSARQRPCLAARSRRRSWSDRWASNVRRIPTARLRWPPAPPRAGSLLTVAVNATTSIEDIAARTRIAALVPAVQLGRSRRARRGHRPGRGGRVQGHRPAREHAARGQPHVAQDRLPAAGRREVRPLRELAGTDPTNTWEYLTWLRSVTSPAHRAQGDHDRRRRGPGGRCRRGRDHRLQPRRPPARPVDRRRSTPCPTSSPARAAWRSTSTAACAAAATSSSRSRSGRAP